MQILSILKTVTAGDPPPPGVDRSNKDPSGGAASEITPNPPHAPPVRDFRADVLPDEPARAADVD